VIKNRIINAPEAVDCTVEAMTSLHLYVEQSKIVDLIYVVVRNM